MALFLVVVFLVVPVLELFVLLRVADIVGFLPAVALMIVVSVAGGWLVRREGLRAWRRVGTELQSGRMPANEVLDGALILFGGALLLTPGFLTDALGLSLLVPPSRALIRLPIRRRLERGVRRGAVSWFGATTFTDAGGARITNVWRSGDVIDVDGDEVIDTRGELPPRP